MTYPGSKDWYIQKLKELGLNYHPVDRKKIEGYTTNTLRTLYLEMKKDK